MPDEFSIPELLSLLQIDRNHTAIQLSLEADRLCRLRQYRPAIDVAESATQLVRTDPWLLGETLLYLSYARLCSNLPEQVRQAGRDRDRAIRALGLSTYNYAVANLIRGQMELHSYGVTGRLSALRYFQRASEVLEKLRVEESQYNRASRAGRCLELKAQADQQIKQLMQKMAATPEMKIPPKQRPSKPPTPAPAPQPAPEQAVPLPQEEPAEVSLGDRLILQYLIWPPKEPPLVIDAPPGMTGLMPDFLGIRQLSVQNRVYDVKPLAGDEPVQLRLRQNYWITPLEGASHGELALVREQARPDQAEQFVVVSEPTARRVWIDKAEATDNFTHIHVIGAERDWVMHDFSPEHLDMSEPRIIGIVEAILIPAADKTTLAPNVTAHITPSMAIKLPLPQKIKLASGKTRMIYRDFAGQFISKAKYESLKGKAGRPPKPSKRVGRQPKPAQRKAAKGKAPAKVKQAAARRKTIAGKRKARVKTRRRVNPAIESLTRLLNKLEKGELPLVNELLQHYLHATPPPPPANPAQESLVRLLDKIEQGELPIINNLVQHLIHTTALKTPPIDLVALSDVDRVAYLNQLDSLTARAEIERYLQATRQAQQPPRLPGLYLQSGDLSRLDLHGSDLHDADLYRCDFTHTNLSEANLRGVNLTNARCDEADLPQVDLTGARISGAILTSAKLIGARLIDTRCEGTNFSQADLSGVVMSDRTTLHNATLTEARLRDAQMTGVNCTGAKFPHADLQRADLRQSNLAEAVLTEAHLEHADLTEALLHDADFNGAHFAETNLEGTLVNNPEATFDQHGLRLWEVSNLAVPSTIVESGSFQNAIAREAKLADRDLTKVDFTGADLTKADLRRTNLQRVALAHANLGKARLEGAKLEHARLNSAYLGGAYLRRAQLNSANLTNADLSAADLRSADLKGALLRRANLQDADLVAADLRDADFKEANLTRANLRGALVDVKRLEATARSLSGATMPDGSIHP